jgi:hypothetical protein
MSDSLNSRAAESSEETTADQSYSYSTAYSLSSFSTCSISIYHGKMGNSNPTSKQTTKKRDSKRVTTPDNSGLTTKRDSANSLPVEQSSKKSCLTDLSNSKDSQKLLLAPTRESDSCDYAWILPSQLKEVELSIPHSMADCRFELQADRCENLERM